MTAEQFIRWEKYYAAEPWGESRADQRAAANTLFGLAPYMKREAILPDLHYPYFDDDGTPEALAKRARAIDKWLLSQNSQSSSSPTPAG